MYHGKKVSILMETLSAAFGGEIGREYYNESRPFVLYFKQEIVVYAGNILPECFTQKQVINQKPFSSSRRTREIKGSLFSYSYYHGHLERDGYGVHTVLKVSEAGAVCRDSFSSPRPSG